MDWMIGIVCLVGTALLFYLVRPRERDSLLLCGLCAVAGVLSPDAAGSYAVFAVGFYLNKDIIVGMLCVSVTAGSTQSKSHCAQSRVQSNPSRAKGFSAGSLEKVAPLWNLWQNHRKTTQGDSPRENGKER